MKSISEILGLTILFVSGLLLFYLLFSMTFIGEPVPYWGMIKQYLIVAITLFIPLSAISYTLFRRKIRQKQLSYNLREFGIGKDEIVDLIEIYGHDTSLTSHLENIEQDNESNAQDSSLAAFARLLLAVLLTMVMSFLGLTVLFYGDEIDISNGEQATASNLFLGGMKALNIKLVQESAPQTIEQTTTTTSQEDNQETKTETRSEYSSPLPTQQDNYQKGALLMFGMAAMGAILWGFQHIVQRYMLFDICPGVYYSLSIRIIVASVIAVAIYHSLDALSDGLFTLLSEGQQENVTAGEQLSGILPGIALLIGMFPKRGLVWLKEKLPLFSDDNDPTVKRLPLSMIQGINQHQIIRLNELGIDNCYQLAEKSLLPMIVMTPYSPDTIIRWIAQAKLCVYFGDALSELRDVGIYTIFDIYAPLLAEANNKPRHKPHLWPQPKDEAPKPFAQVLVEETKVKSAQAKHILDEIMEDRCIEELYRYYQQKRRNHCESKSEQPPPKTDAPTA